MTVGTPALQKASPINLPGTVGEIPLSQICNMWKAVIL